MYPCTAFVANKLLHYRQAGQLCWYCFYSQSDFSVFRPAGATHCTDQGEICQGGVDRRSAAPPCQISPWSAKGCGFTAPKISKFFNFTNIIAPKGLVPCQILTKFAGFMRVIDLHNSANFSWIISINDKIINNLPPWERFQTNFRCPLAAKLLTQQNSKN